MKKILSSGLGWFWIVIAIVAIDRYCKFWIVQHLSFMEYLPILPVFNLTLVYNKGAAFSFLSSASGWQNLFLGCLAVSISLVIVYWLYHSSHRNRLHNIALCLILSGALGNVWDRALYGYVVDFFDFHIGNWHFAIFNTADAAICVGAFLLLMQCFKWAR